jgi:hypothetical protein
MKGAFMSQPGKLTPREYAKHRSEKTGTIVQAQLIYYYIRKGDLVLETCACGRNVLDVPTTNEFFDAKDKR